MNLQNIASNYPVLQHLHSGSAGGQAIQLMSSDQSSDRTEPLIEANPAKIQTYSATANNEGLRAIASAQSSIAFLEKILSNQRAPLEAAEKIAKMQAALSSTTAREIPVSNNSSPFFITQHGIFVLGETLAQGAQSSVFIVKEINVLRQSVATKILKMGNRSYAREAKLFTADAARYPIDLIQQNYAVQGQNQRYIAIFEKSEGDFCHVNYAELKSPVSFIVAQLTGVMRGLVYLHAKKIIHRDIKGANLLIGKEWGKITDTGLAMTRKSSKIIHNTAVTTFFAAPFIWDSLENQIKRRGHQGEKADLFALGRTIQYNVIFDIFKQLGDKHQITLHSDLKAIWPVKKNLGDVTPEKFTEDHPESVIVLSNLNRANLSAYVFPNGSTLYDRTIKVANYFQEFLAENEFKGLLKLAKLAHRLQNPAREEIRSTRMIEWKIRKIQEICSGKYTKFTLPESMAPIIKKLDFSEVSQGLLFGDTQNGPEASYPQEIF